MSALAARSVRVLLQLSIASLAIASIPFRLSAQVAQASSPPVIRCGARSGAQVECKTTGYATNVRLVREVSRNRCRQGSNWGYTDSFIWANGGCEAEFQVTYRPATVDPGFGAGGTRRITCGTTSGAQVECKTNGYATNVRLVRELSNNRCRQGSNWGHTDSFIWANKGCRAIFEVTYRITTPAPPTPVTRIITCGTTSGAQVECKTNGSATGVRLVRDLSRNRCRQGHNWGHTDSFIWANNGCRAEFEVTYRTTTPTPPPTPVPGTRVIACGSAGGGNVSCNPFGTVASVRLVRDRSGNRCRQGSTWGYSEDDIWAKQGCHGDFEVTYKAVPQPR